MLINEVEPGQKEKFVPSNTDENRTFQKFLSDCSQSIEAMKSAKKFLYRGITNPEHGIFVGRSRDNRDTRDSSSMLSGKVDEILKAGGLTAIRSNSIFCTSVLSDANFYGTQYIIFPKNGFDFTWSPKVSDFTAFANSFQAYDAERIYKLGQSHQDKYEQFNDYFEEFRKLKLYISNIVRNIQAQSNEQQKKGLPQLILLSNELTDLFSPSFNEQEFVSNIQRVNNINGIEPTKPSEIQNLLKLRHLKQDMMQPMEINDADIFKGLGFINHDFVGALKSQNEIMIRGEYYAFLQQKYQPELYNLVY